MTDLLNVVERAKDNPLLIEEYLARETIGDEGGDPTAPPPPAEPSKTRICRASTGGRGTTRIWPRSCCRRPKRWSRPPRPRPASACDVGCGTGNAALLAAGRGARVTGVDPAPRLIEVAAAEALDRGFEAEFVLGEASSIPLGDDSANLVLSVFGAICRSRPRGGGRRDGAGLRSGRPHRAERLGPRRRARRCGAHRSRGDRRSDRRGPARRSLPVARAEGARGAVRPARVRGRARRAFADLHRRLAAGVRRDRDRQPPLWVAGREALVAAGTDEAVRRRVLEIFEQGNEDPDGFRETSRYAIVTATRAG